MADLESIGGVSVTISGDYSQLMTDLQTSQGLAEDAGSQIADALESGAAGAESLTESTTQLASALDTTSTSAEAAAGGTEKLNENLQETQHESEGAGEGLSEMAEKAVELATELGIVVGVGELIKETFEAFATVESATVALTALTGSADDARERIELLEQMAVNENLSFPALLEANQRMVAFGFSADDIPSALQAAADSAAALNTSVAETANAIDRMAASGMAGARQLVSLGLTTKDLADVMGVTEDKVKLAFAALDQNTRLEVLTAALDKFAGQAQVAADTLKGQWQGVKNTFEGFFVTLGNFLEPAAKAILEFFSSVGKAAEAFTLALEINLEKLEFYFEKFTGQADAAMAKAKEVNENVAKFQALLSGGTGVGAGVAGAPTGGASDLAGLQAKVAAQLAAANTEILPPDKLKAIQDATSDLAIMADELALVEKQNKATAEAIAAYGVSLNEAGVIVDGASLKQKYFYDAMSQAITGMAAAQNALPPVIDDMGNLSASGDRTTKSFQEVGKSITETNKLLDDLSGKVKPPTDALHEGLAKIDKDLASGNFSQIQQIINRLAVDDLPTAVVQQDRYVDALENAGAGQAKLNAALQEQVTLHEQLAAVQGQSLTKYQVQLGLVDIQTKNLGFDTDHVLGTTAVAGINAMDKALTSLGPQFAKLIVEGGSFGKVMHQIFTTLAEDILSAIINAVVKMGEEFVVEKLLEQTTTSTENVSAVTSQAAVAAANAFASTAAIPIVGPALAPAAAAEAEAFVLALAPQAAFQEGGFVPETMLALVHKGEYVVPASQVQASAGAGAPSGLTINIGTMHGVTRDTVNAVATAIVRQAKLAGAFH